MIEQDSLFKIIPFVFPALVTLGILEWLYLKKTKEDVREFNHTLIMVVWVATQAVLLSPVMNSVFLFFHEARFITFDPSWWALLLLIVLIDLSLYFGHRLQHTFAIGWAEHQAHHSARQLNGFVAFRQNPIGKLVPFTFLPLFVLPFLGFHPFMIALVYPLFVVVDFIQHTQWGWAPRWSRFVFVTPALHRVHHSSSPRHLNRNFGVLFSFWDRIFGTYYEPRKDETLEYGLAEPFRLKGLFEPYREIFRKN